MKSLIAFIVFNFTSSLFAGTCDQVQIKIIFNKKPITTQEIICTKKTSDNMLFYISKSCEDNKCDILTRKKSILDIKDYYGQIGSPGFKICTELGGVPQIFEFSRKNDLWQSTERCLFGKNDFVEISLLTHEWKSFINR